MAYTINPWLSLTPVSESPRQVLYSDVPVDRSLAPENCVQMYHPKWIAYLFHQGSPFYRLTLCNRGCVADEHNTVFITLGHIMNRPRYAK